MKIKIILYRFLPANLIRISLIVIFYLLLSKLSIKGKNEDILLLFMSVLLSIGITGLFSITQDSDKSTNLIAGLIEGLTYFYKDGLYATSSTSDDIRYSRIYVYKRKLFINKYIGEFIDTEDITLYQTRLHEVISNYIKMDINKRLDKISNKKRYKDYNNI